MIPPCFLPILKYLLFAQIWKTKCLFLLLTNGYLIAYIYFFSFAKSYFPCARPCILARFWDLQNFWSTTENAMFCFHLICMELHYFLGHFVQNYEFCDQVLLIWLLGSVSLFLLSLTYLYMWTAFRMFPIRLDGAV